MNKPTIKVRKAPNFPENVEVDLEWPGAYKTMLTFHVDDFEGDRAKKIIAAHVGMIKRDIEHREIAQAVMDSSLFGMAPIKKEGAKITYDK